MKKYISMALTAALALSMQSFAAEIDVVQKNGSVTLSISGAESGRQIAIKVENEDGDVRFLDDNYADENGEYSVTYNMGTEGGKFSVTAHDGTNETTKTFMIRTTGMENALINELKNQAASSSPDSAAFKSLMENYWLALELNDELFNTLADKDEVYVKMVEDSGNASVKDFNELANAFYKAVVLEKYKELTNKKDICDVLAKTPYLEAFGDEGEFFAARLNDIVGEAAPYITSDMARDYVNAEKFMYDIQFSLLRAAISKSPVWTGVKKVAENYKGKIGISGSVSNEKYKAITKNDYSSYAAVKSALTSSSGSGGSGGSGGGSGSGKGSGGSVAMPVNPPVTPTEVVASGNGKKQGKSIFTDMEEFNWADEAVSAIYNLGIVNGDGDGCFGPARGVSRAEAAKMIVLLMKKDISNPIDIPFVDISKDHWSYPYISAAYAGGIINGKSADWFDGESGVTRQEMAVMVWNAMKTMGFTDKGRELFVNESEIADWAIDAVGILSNYGIVNILKVEGGYAFKPEEQINRAEAAIIIYNVAKLLS